MSTPAITQKRTRTGCWTCKRRRRKCDEARPSCKLCLDGGHMCEGYATRLRWDAGVASRGILAGASEPRREAAPHRQKGRKRDLLKWEKEHLQTIDLNMSDCSSERSSPQDTLQLCAIQTSTSADTPDLGITPGNLRFMQKETLFQEFVSTGYTLLHSTKVDESPLLPMLHILRQRSDALFHVCVACQAYISNGANEAFYDYYDEALTEFRADLNHPVRQHEDAIFIAALLLCTVGILQGTPYTIHLQGLEKLLNARTATLTPDVFNPCLTQSLEVMGVMDMDAFVIGRQSPGLGVWRTFRSFPSSHIDEERDSIEHVSGLPRSFLDLLSREADHLTEQDMWSWPGYPGAFLQCHLWEAYRHATILAIRRRRRRKLNLLQDHNSLLNGFRHSEVPSDEIVVARALSSIDAIQNGVTKPAAADSLVMNAILYPLFIVSLEVLLSNQYQQWHDLVRQWFDAELETNPFANVKLAWQILETAIEINREGILVGPDDIARSQNIEVSLL